MQLRPYQEKIIQEIRAQFNGGVRSVQLALSTGAGKTIVAAAMIESAVKKGLNVWVILHRREILRQFIRSLDAFSIKFDVINDGYLQTNQCQVKLASIQTLRNRYQYLPRPHLLVWDENHHLGAVSYKRIYSHFPDAFHVGLSATPERMDGQGLGAWFKALVKGPSVRDLITQGYLSDYRVFAPPGVSVEGVGVRGGDYAKEQIAKQADKPVITGNALNEYLKHAMGKRAVIFAAGIEHSKNVCAMFQANGVPAVHVDGETDLQFRDEAIRLFQEGKIYVLGNVDLFGEGFDLPTLECVIMLRPTMSRALYRQQVGRALRPSDGKKFAVILDHAGNTMRHGLVEEEIEWTLEGRPAGKKNSEAQVKVKVCPKCFAAQAPNNVCRYCGHIFETKEREVQRQEGELKELDLEAIKRQRNKEQGRARSYEELVAVGLARGMRDPLGWARHVVAARQEKEARLSGKL